MEDIILDCYHRPIRLLVRQATELGRLAALIDAGILKPYLKKSDAFRLYGRAATERWLDQGLLTPRKDGDQSSAWRIDRMEIEILSRAVAIFHQL